ncbi:MAG: ABC transporter ATP-binding protein [Acidobacteriota bacterium]|nr:ABC transporter ATP-binding protein [Acidobacteriota bacterium]
MTTPSARHAASRPSTFRWMLDCMRPYRPWMAVLALLSVVEVGLGALAPWPLKVVVDNVLRGQAFPPALAALVDRLTGGSRTGLLVLVVLAGFAIQVANEVASMLHTQVQVDTGQRMVFDLRGRLFAHLQALGLSHFVTTSTGDAVYRLETDAYCINDLVMTGLFPLASAVLTLAVMFTVLVRLDPTIALLSLAVVPVLYACLRHYTSALVDRAERVKELESRLVERLYETFAAIRLVKSFAREPYEAGRFAEHGRAAMAGRVSLTWQESLFSVLITTTTLAGTALVVIVGGLHVLSGRLTVGALLVVIAYLGAVYGPLSAIAHTTGSLQQALAGARRVRAALALAPEPADAPGTADATAIRGRIEFQQVGFTYPDGTRVLDDISFSAAPGELVAIVGLTGAGKTTLVSLIPRFYEPTAGRVLIDGVDATRYGLRALRQRIAVVLQEPALFAGTIADNLRYGRLDAADDELEDAARAAQAHDFIVRLADGYDTPIGEAGGGLSGGERQRIGIARAVVKDAPILILDEPTSALDAISEEAVFSALRRLRAGRTTIVIAHRLSTVRDADRILVLDGGRLAAQGRHDELLERSTLYRRMCARLSVGRSLDEPETVDEILTFGGALS